MFPILFFIILFEYKTRLKKHLNQLAKNQPSASLTGLKRTSPLDLDS